MNKPIDKVTHLSSVEDNFRGAYIKKAKEMTSVKDKKQVLTSFEENMKGAFVKTKKEINIAKERGTLVNIGIAKKSRKEEQKYTSFEAYFRGVFSKKYN